MNATIVDYEILEDTYIALKRYIVKKSVCYLIHLRKFKLRLDMRSIRPYVLQRKLLSHIEMYFLVVLFLKLGV